MTTPDEVVEKMLILMQAEAEVTKARMGNHG